MRHPRHQARAASERFLGIVQCNCVVSRIRREFGDVGHGSDGCEHDPVTSQRAGVDANDDEFAVGSSQPGDVVVAGAAVSGCDLFQQQGVVVLEEVFQHRTVDHRLGRRLQEIRHPLVGVQGDAIEVDDPHTLVEHAYEVGEIDISTACCRAALIGVVYH
ncbi:unannotated protein [freshwater metagenome]|uniref:Unannotated protein n=1 Tax=freshwater metagenome TaxID=449393 RepID=A0A6J7C6X5_9ZZZZ